MKHITKTLAEIGDRLFTIGDHATPQEKEVKKWRTA
jgi:hypothetical protein